MPLEMTLTACKQLRVRIEKKVPASPWDMLVAPPQPGDQAMKVKEPTDEAIRVLLEALRPCLNADQLKGAQARHIALSEQALDMLAASGCSAGMLEEAQREMEEHRLLLSALRRVAAS